MKGDVANSSVQLQHFESPHYIVLYNWMQYYAATFSGTMCSLTNIILFLSGYLTKSALYYSELINLPKLGFLISDT